MSTHPPRRFPDKPLGTPLKSFDATFSAQTIMLDEFFPNRKECPHCKGHGRVGVMACNHCGATGQAVLTPGSLREGAE